MTVKELRNLLAVFPDDTRVFVKGYEWGWKDALPPQLTRVQLDANSDGYGGPHEVLDTPADEDFAVRYNWRDEPVEIIDGVILPRSE